MNVSQKILAEFTGTLLLVATVVGSGIMSIQMAGGNMALALIGNTLATGAILYVLISIFGQISGAHFNPAVSMVFFLRNELSLPLLLGFIGAQMSGGFTGTLIAHAMFEQELIQYSTHIRTGGAQWLAEIIACFGLVTTILLGVRYATTSVPMLVALFITAGYWFTASTSFANPAVTFARGFTDSFSGIAPENIIGFMIAQLIGAALAWRFCKLFNA